MDIQTKITPQLQVSLGKWNELRPTLKLDGNNPHFKSKYATLKELVSKIKEPLEQCGLTFSHFENGNTIYTVLMLTGEDNDGGCIVSSTNLPDSKMQDRGAAITYARRYHLSSMLGLVSEEDVDGNTVDSGKPSLTAKALEAAIHDEVNGIRGGNRQILTQVLQEYTVDAKSVVKIVVEMAMEFDEYRQRIINRLENKGYEVTLREIKD